MAFAETLSLRTIQAWETGKRPRVLEDVSKVATVLSAAQDAMLSKSDQCVIKAYEKGGARAAWEVEGLINEVDEQFAGRDIDEQEKEGIAAAMCEAYWIAKRRNQKYTPKKYRK